MKGRCKPSRSTITISKWQCWNNNALITSMNRLSKKWMLITGKEQKQFVSTPKRISCLFDLFLLTVVGTSTSELETEPINGRLGSNRQKLFFLLFALDKISRGSPTGFQQNGSPRNLQHVNSTRISPVWQTNPTFSYFRIVIKWDAIQLRFFVGATSHIRTVESANPTSITTPLNWEMKSWEIWP